VFEKPNLICLQIFVRAAARQRGDLGGSKSIIFASNLIELQHGSDIAMKVSKFFSS
jgi:hypothetical protein